MDSSILRISNPERVQRILDRVIEAQLGVLFRWPKEPSVSVKGRVTAMFDFYLEGGKKAQGLRISNISEKGMRYIWDKDVMQVEFVLMSTKVVFVCKIVSKDQNHVVVTVPKHLISVNRRKNERYASTENLQGLFRFEMFRPRWEDFAASPCYQHYSKMSGYMKIEDVSLGGICVSSTFPSVNKIARRGLIDDAGEILLPMQKPVTAPIELRWIKRIKEHHKDDDGSVRQFMSYRLGLQFLNMNQEIETAIRMFIQQTTQQEAI
jgi:hypothetical protein